MPPRAAETPTPARRARKGSISRAAWFALIVGLVVLVLLLVFILQNNTSAQFNFWAATFTLPLGVAMLFAAIAGALVTALVGTTRMIALGRTVRRLEQQHGERRGRRA
ncbi:MAG: lipopolysaccharide assembly protein LapA domain-containing protein [Propionibacterium sp.]|nr:lipopolysaccharide assembly protein LapA domain-containing protein [Propionibacterium sp.]